MDLSQPNMNAFRGGFGFSVVGTDRAGNVGRTDAGVTVTRWKWVFHSPDGQPIGTSPAIGASGTVYIGTGNNVSAGTVYAINPDGTLNWSSPGGSITASLAVGELDGGIEPVYVAMNDAASTTLRALNGLDGGNLVVPCLPFPGNARGSLAVTKINGGEACFAAINNTATPGTIVAFRPFPAALCVDGGTAVNPGGQLMEPAAVAIDSFNNAYSALTNMRVQSLLFDGGWQTRQGWPVDAGANNAALAISNGTIVGAATNMNGGFGGVFTQAPARGLLAKPLAQVCHAEHPPSAMTAPFTLPMRC